MSKFGFRMIMTVLMVLPFAGCGSGVEDVKVKKVDEPIKQLDSVPPDQQPKGTTVGRSAGKINPVTGLPAGAPLGAKPD